jgi:hypothetical protein
MGENLLEGVFFGFDQKGSFFQFLPILSSRLIAALDWVLRISPRVPYSFFYYLHSVQLV